MMAARDRNRRSMTVMVHRLAEGLKSLWLAAFLSVAVDHGIDLSFLLQAAVAVANDATEARNSNFLEELASFQRDPNCGAFLLKNALNVAASIGVSLTYGTGILNVTDKFHLFVHMVLGASLKNVPYGVFPSSESAYHPIQQLETGTPLIAATSVGGRTAAYSYDIDNNELRSVNSPMDYVMVGLPSSGMAMNPGGRLQEQEVTIKIAHASDVLRNDSEEERAVKRAARFTSFKNPASSCMPHSKSSMVSSDDDQPVVFQINDSALAIQPDCNNDDEACSAIDSIQAFFQSDYNEHRVHTIVMEPGDVVVLKTHTVLYTRSNGLVYSHFMTQETFSEKAAAGHLYRYSAQY